MIEGGGGRGDGGGDGAHDPGADGASVAGGLARVRARIVAACARAGREAAAVTLVAVSKTHLPERVREAYRAGQRVFGESYAQELADKAPALADLRDLRWHFIGHLQRNKVKQVLPFGPVVEGVDSERLGRALDARAAETGVVVPVFVQVNVGREPQKSGCPPEQAPALVAFLRGLRHLEVRGLMAVPPLSDAAEASRPSFRELASLAAQLGLTELSMGMSHDLEVAIEEGATVVRVGTAIFGTRPP